MPTVRSISLSISALLLGVLPLVVAHGDDHSDAGTHMSHGDHMAPPPTSSPVEPVIPSYFRHPDYQGWMYAHIFLMVIAWVIVLPVGVMLSIARSRLLLLFQFSFLVANSLGLFTGFVYNHKTPDLYEKNAHHTAGWILAWIAHFWIVGSLLRLYIGRKATSPKQEHPTPLSEAVLARYQRLQLFRPAHPHRWSGDSGQGTERNSSSLYSSPHTGSVASDAAPLPDAHPTAAPPIREHEDYDDVDVDDALAEEKGFLKNTSVDRFLSRNAPRIALGRAWKVFIGISAFVERTILVGGFVAIVTGAIVWGGIARGDAVFNALAHFIKGGIFFWYGLLTLGRWMGAFSDFGWAWNVKPPKEVVGRFAAWVPSAEFTESFVICLYGASNVFLEHLAAWGDRWTAQDLEHVSITIMFFGGGLFGMLIESRTVRKLLNTTILARQPVHFSHNITAMETWKQPKTYSTALNPIPALVIMLLGLMMSSHHQTSMVSTMVHKQWGTLFVGFALARSVTYLIMFLSPPTSYLPSRPPSELISAFCLCSGGLIFMGSNKDVVAALEYNGLDAMFIFTVTMGVNSLIMAWATIVVAIKGWAVRREGTATFQESPEQDFTA